MTKNNIACIFKILKKVKEDDIFTLSAQFSFYIILGIFPFSVLLMSFFSRFTLHLFYILDMVKSIIPLDVYNFIYNIIIESSSNLKTSYMSASLIALLWSASSGSTGVIKGINKAYDYPIKRNYFFMRLKGIFFTICLIFSLGFIFAGIIIGNHLIFLLQKITLLSDLIYIIINILRYFFPLLNLLVLFLFIYKYIPYEKVKFRFALPGAVFSTIGCILGSYIFSIYLNKRITYYNNIYGSLSQIFIFILWIYITSTIFLIGAEINAFINLEKIKKEKS